MGVMKQLYMEQMDEAEPCPSDFVTKEEYEAYFHPKKSKKRRRKYKSKRKAIESTPTYDSGAPMSIKRPFDNAEAWLDDEPWRKW